MPIKGITMREDRFQNESSKLRRIAFLPAITSALALLIGCESRTYERQVANIEQVVASHKIGSSSDYFLTKNGADRVALIFGMTDDFSFCSDVADMYQKRYPAERWSCVPAQQ